MEKQRLDILLFEKGIATSREKAKAMIMAGIVLVNEQKIDKAGTLVPVAANIRIAGNPNAYVSRGGLKLAKALQYFKIDLSEKIMADIGASTGGFTDCALQNGAIRVYAIDVGYGQLAWSLRNDQRVINMERTNVRNIKAEDLGELLDFATIDVAFISLGKVLPAIKLLLKENAELIALIKPQFEAGKDKIGKKGVVKDPKIHKEVIQNIFDITHELGFNLRGLTFSPIKGPEGNIEYLIYLENCVSDKLFDIEIIDQVVDNAHGDLTS